MEYALHWALKRNQPARVRTSNFWKECTMKKIVALTAALAFLTASASFAAEETPTAAPTDQKAMEKAPVKKAEHHVKKHYHHHVKKHEVAKVEKKAEAPAEAPAAE